VRRLRVAASCIAATFAIAQSATIAGCGDDDNAPAAKLDGGGTPDVTLSDVVDIDATQPDPDAGAFTIVDLPDSPCAVRADVGKVVFTSATYDAVLSLSAIGSRRVAQRKSGFVIMDADGSNPTATITSSRAAAALDATTIAAVSTDGAGPLLSLYDANGAPKATGLLAYDAPPYGLTVTGGGSEGLMVWGSAFGVFARGIAPTTFMAPAFPVASSGAVGSFAASIARRANGEFAVAFSGITPDTDEEARLSFVRMTTTGRIAQGFHLEIGKAPRRVVQLVPRTNGWALLVDYGISQRAHLVLLDAEGRLDGPVYRLGGASIGYGLASSGGELAVLALHDAPSSSDGGVTDAGVNDAGDAAAGDAASTTTPSGLRRAAFRALDEKGAALGDWTCFGDGVDSHGGTEGAILGEDNGYTLAFPKANGDVVIARVDRRGN
jgi:hypothetical protein